MKKTIIRNEKELKCMLVELFEGNAAGTNWHAVHDNYLPIVQFAMKQEKMKSTILKGDEKEISHACLQLKVIVEKLDGLAETENSSYIEEADKARELLNDLKKAENCELFKFYKLLVENWNILKGLSATYRLLADLVKLSKNMRNDAKVKMELLWLAGNVATEWKD